MDENKEEEWRETWQAGKEFADWQKAVKHDPYCALPMLQRVEGLFCIWRVHDGETDVEKVVGQANRYYQRRSDNFCKLPPKPRSGQPDKERWVEKHPDRFAPRYWAYMNKITLLVRSEAVRVRPLRAFVSSLTDHSTGRQREIQDDSESTIQAILRREMSEELWNVLKKHLSDDVLKLIDLNVIQGISSRDIVDLWREKTNHTTICKLISNALRNAYFFIIWDKRLRGVFIDDTEALDGRNK